MPSQILHILFGEDIIAGIYRRISPFFGIVADRAMEKLQYIFRTAFALGCQGPDIFYHSRKRRPVGLEYGSLLHRRGAGTFTAELLKLGLPDQLPGVEGFSVKKFPVERLPVEGFPQGSQNLNALGAYALGFMTHAILDRAAHPYIVYKSGFSNKKSGAQRNSLYHIFFERVLDVLMFRKKRGKNIDAWDQDVLTEACGKPPSGLGELLARALVFAFPERAGKDEKLARRIDNTFLDCTGFYKYTDPGYVDSADSRFCTIEELAYIYPKDLCDSEGNTTVDFLNLENRPWQYPLEGREQDCRSFPEIYSDAAESAINSICPVIVSYLETGVFPIDEATQAIGNGGLSIADENGKPCIPTLCDPLPLDEILLEQAEMRGIA